ncbi:zinc finger MYND domain-containing protein [Phanerochaete sordida]|uniref:Zinc finger MYND domain-containing protein n=1 Tax=Phanerochaete sordida TaxID=48140 RepID=A0A9P3GNA5_9APHY|nr:zinc finger MYND domain-containing protein [Phanerochaete sordida]
MVAPPSTATSPSSSAPPSPSPPPICRALPFTLGPDNPCTEPLLLGARGPAWFLLYARHTRRVHAPIAIVVPAEPVLEPSPAGRARIAFRETPGMGLLAGLLAARVPPQGAAAAPDAPARAVAKPTGRMLAPGVPEVELLLDDADVAHGCSCCGRFETPGEPAYKRCGGCRARYYCSPKCQRNDWLMRHKEICALIKQGRFVDVERIELAGPMSEVSWQISDMMSALSGQPRPGARDWAKMREARESAPPSVVPPRPSAPAPQHDADESDDEEGQQLSDESELEEGSDEEDVPDSEDSDSDWEDEEDEDEEEEEEEEEEEGEDVEEEEDKKVARQEREQEKTDPAPPSGLPSSAAEPLAVA